MRTHYDVTMNNHVAIGTHHKVTMHNDIAMTLIYNVLVQPIRKLLVSLVNFKIVHKY